MDAHQLAQRVTWHRELWVLVLDPSVPVTLDLSPLHHSSETELDPRFVIL